MPQIDFPAIAQALLDDLAPRLANTPGKTPTRVGPVPGAIAWDECDCDQGQLVISLGRIYLSSSFPNVYGESPETLTSCEAPYLAADMTMQIVRCAPLPQGEDLAPTVQALSTAHALIVADATVLMKAVSCKLTALEDAYQISAHVVRPVLVVGPMGGCMGSQLDLSVAILRTGL